MRLLILAKQDESEKKGKKQNKQSQIGKRSCGKNDLDE